MTIALFVMTHPAFAAADDNIPGVSIPSSPISGSLDYDTDYDDVYAVNLTAGQIMIASITGPTGSEFNLYLYPPTSTDLSDNDYVVYAESSTYPNKCSYIVPSGAGGKYYLDAYCKSGSGSYTIKYSIRTANSDDNIPGVTLPSSPIAGSLNENSDIDDVYKTSLSAGKVIYASISGATGTDFSLSLFPPSATDINWDWDSTVAVGFGSAYPYRLRYVVPSGSGGTYYLDTYCHKGTGSYTIQYATKTAETDDSLPGKSIAASPQTGSLSETNDLDDFYKISLSAGHVLYAKITGPTGSNLGLSLFGPGSTDFNWDDALVYDFGDAYPYRLHYTVPPGKGGTYSLDTYAYAGSGSYSIAYSVVSAGSDDVFPGIALKPALASGSLNVDSDYQDIYVVPLTAGQRIEASLVGPSGSDFDLMLFPPGTTDSSAGEQVKESKKTSYPEAISYTVPTGKGGKYSIVTSAYKGSGQYSLFYTIRDANAAREWLFYE